MRMVTKQDILEALGMETETKFMTGLFVGIGLGAVVGGAIALLFAPKTGTEMREMIGEQAGKMKETMKTKLGRNGNEASETPIEPPKY